MPQSASAIFDIIAPQYASDPDKADFISLARDRTNAGWYLANYEYAVALRAAHMITLTRTRADGESGSVTSKREGDLGIGYGSVGGGKGGELNLTHYGRQLEGLRKASGAFIGVTGGLDDGSHS